MLLNFLRQPRLPATSAFAVAAAFFILPGSSSSHAFEMKPNVAYRADATTPPPLPNSPKGGRWQQARKPVAPPRLGTEEIAGTTYNYITPNPINGQTDDPDSFGSYQFLLIPEWIKSDKGWTATAVVRVLSASSVNLHSCSFRLFDQEVEYMLSIFNDPDRNQQGVVLRSNGMELARRNGYNNVLIPHDVSSDYRTYQLYYNPDEEKLTLYIDGKEVASQDRSDLHRNTESSGRIRWGKETANTGEARWNEVRFELGKAIIPEKN